jgi:3',5'-cyclic AMP phosphodiesterase CpdA
MPIHVPPLSRRQFLAGSLAAGAGLLWGDRLQAATVDAQRFALLADIHLWEHRDREARSIRPAARFVQARDQLLALSPRPAAAIVAGDCAFGEGHAGDYAVLAELVQPIRQAGLPLHFLMGNHDHRDNFYAAFPEARPNGTSPVVDRHVALLETPVANWLLLDSLEKTNYVPGRLGKEQLEWLARTLDAHPDKPALVMAHHYPDHKPKTTGLEDTQALLDVLLPRKQAKAFVFGHSHRWEFSTQDGLHLVNLPTLVWVFDKAQPAGWVDARLRPDGIALTLNALDKSHPAHGQIVELKWRS